MLGQIGLSSVMEITMGIELIVTGCTRNGGSPFTSLCKDAGLVESSFLPIWCGLGSLWFSEGNSLWVAWSVCGENL